ncbi:MAG: phosphoenolpyruvate carboxykinase (ATP) [Oligoflexia bacterium]|nr:phosphoenolpyruvate carboxykinase (ATP) [Oligoflexia bacterium]
MSRSDDTHAPRLSDRGALIVSTGAFTGRAARKKFIARNSATERRIAWGAVNQPVPDAEARRIWDALEAKFRAATGSGPRAGVHPYRGFVGPYALSFKTCSAWHAAFARNMFRATPAPLGPRLLERTRRVSLQILHDPDTRLSELGVSFPTEAAIILDPARCRIAIVGTGYAGEIKKAAFSLCNILLPDLGILPMHAAANCFADGRGTSVLFGLSGTGKTTLSADPDRYLIGDDELAWSPTGISNLEGGCYAKLIDLDPEKEPLIYRAVNRPGAILENVGFEPGTGRVDFSDRSRTENTRGSYPLSSLEKTFDPDREADEPSTIVFLTADAFGALPAVARLDEFQAQYHFISGYTAKVAGTELGVSRPEATFSACFGAPFMPLHVTVYARLLASLARRSGASVWLLNTGWLGEDAGHGPRIPIPVSRGLLAAIQSGALDSVPMRIHPIFGFEIPLECPGVPAEFLRIPEGQAVAELARRFAANIDRISTEVPGGVPRDILEKGGPLPARRAA